MNIPRLHLVSDSSLCPLEDLPRIARLAVAGGVDAVHLREKDLGGGPLLDAVLRVKDAVAGRALVFVNERVDVALLAGADGVQLGETALAPSQVRRLVGDALLIGRSIHSADAAREAASDGADFVVAGNIYASRSKPGLSGRGAAFIAEVCSVCPVPVIAIGGITPERMTDVLRAGAHGVAVISGILAAGDPLVAAQRIRAALETFEGPMEEV